MSENRKNLSEILRELELFDLYKPDINTDVLALTNTAKRISGNKDIIISFLDSNNIAFTDCRFIYIPEKFKQDIKGGQGLVAHEAGHIGYGSFELNFIKLVGVISKKFGLSPSFVKLALNVIEDVRINAINEMKFPGFYRNLRILEKQIIPVIKTRIFRYNDIITYLYLYMEDYEGFQTIPNLGPFRLSSKDWNTIIKIKNFIKTITTPSAAILSTYKLCNILKKYIPKKIKRQPNQIPNKTSTGRGSGSYSLTPDFVEVDEGEGENTYYEFEEGPQEGREVIKDSDLLMRWEETREFEKNPFERISNQKSDLQEISEEMIDNLEKVDLTTDDLEELEKEMENYQTHDNMFDLNDENFSQEEKLKEISKSLNEKHKNVEISSEKVEELMEEIEEFEKYHNEFINDDEEGKSSKMKELCERIREKHEDLNLNDNEMLELISEIKEHKQDIDSTSNQGSFFGEESNLELLSEELNEKFEDLNITADDLKSVFEEINNLKENRNKITSSVEADFKSDIDLFKERLSAKTGVQDIDTNDLEESLKNLELVEEKNGNIDIEELLTDKRRRFKVEMVKKIKKTLEKSAEKMEKRLIELERGGRVLEPGGKFKDRKVEETTIDQERMRPVNITYNDIKIKYETDIRRVKRIFSDLRNQRNIDTFQTRGRLNSKFIKAVTSDYKYKRCFTRKTIEKELRLLIIVDISGSMEGIKMRAAKAALIILSEALENIAKIKIVLFTGDHDALNILVKDFNEKIIPSRMDKFGRHNVVCYNLDGISIKHEANKLQKDDFIIVISDGQPAGRDGYGLNEAINDIYEVRKKYKIYAFSIDANGDYLNKLYDKNWILARASNESELSEKMTKLCQIIVKEYFN